jgi:uncharacterized protein
MNRKDAGALERKQFAFKADKVADDGKFAGYGSVFGNVDSYREIVAPGAFAKSLQAIAASGDPLPALWQHSPDQPIGGYDVLAEDDYGLRVEGFLMVNEIPLAKEAHALMKRRVVKGLSIGYYVRADSYDEKTRVRTLLELDLREISIVTFPANDQAEIEAVKSVQNALRGGSLPTLPEFEAFLREAGGFSKSQAAAIAGGGLSKLLSRGEPAGEKGDVLHLLQNFKLTL